MSIRKKLFHLDEIEVNHVLFADNSDDEEKLTLDNKNLCFLEKDVEFIKEKSDSVVLEVTIEPPQVAATQPENEAEEQPEENQEHFKKLSLNGKKLYRKPKSSI